MKAVCLSSLESNQGGQQSVLGGEERDEHIEEGSVMENFQADGLIYYIDEESGDVFVRGENEDELETFRARASTHPYLTNTSYY